MSIDASVVEVVGVDKYVVVDGDDLDDVVLLVEDDGPTVVVQQEGILLGGFVGGGSMQVAYELVTSVNGAQTLSIPVDFYNAGHRLLINGLKQAGSAYTTLGRVVTLPADLGVQAQDLLTFEYYPL